MSDVAPALARPAPRSAGWGSSARFLLLFFLLALAFRSAIVMPRSIPSESMMPGLLPGDYVLVAKWPYGWSRFSLPLAPAAPHGRLFGRPPARGDVVVFRAPPENRRDFIKRVIGLPGDTVQMRRGVLWLNGRAVPRARIADLVLPVVANTACDTIAASRYGLSRDGQTCRFPRWRETLPGGRRYTVLDQGRTAQDDTPRVTVPAGRYLLLGDNRDMSEDSRFATADGGIGLVPAENLEGRAEAIFFSTGGTLAGIRPARIGAVR